MTQLYIVDSALGIFGLDKKGKVVEKRIFSLDLQEVAEKLRKLQSGEAIEELSYVIRSLMKEGPKTFIFESEELSKSAMKETGCSILIEKRSPTIRRFRGRLASYAVKLGAVRDEDEFKRFLHSVTLQTARMTVAEVSAKRDQYAIQMVRAIDDLDRTLNLFAGRIREWYGLHFPELDRHVDKHETYLRLVANLGSRSNFSAGSLKNEGLPEEKIDVIVEAAHNSMGANIDKEDLNWLSAFCRDTLELFKFREQGESYIEGVMKEVAPNMSAVLGPLLAARLISIAGGLDQTSKMPASTLQVLGAEKALFRALKTGTAPPKHGVIFQYAPIHQAPRWQRGKIARALSGKLAIASRIDAFGGDFIGDKLRSDLEKKIEDIKGKGARRR